MDSDAPSRLSDLQHLIGDDVPSASVIATHSDALRVDVVAVRNGFAGTGAAALREAGALAALARLLRGLCNSDVGCHHSLLRAVCQSFANAAVADVDCAREAWARLVPDLLLRTLCKCSGEWLVCGPCVGCLTGEIS